MRKFTLVNLTALFIFTGITYAKNGSESAYTAQTLTFHFYQIDVPSDINLQESIVNAYCAAHEWRVYDVSSQKEFENIVQKKAKELKDFKFSEKEKKRAQKRMEESKKEEKTFLSFYELPMKSALYKLIKYDDTHYEMFSNSQGSKDKPLATSLFIRWFVYYPNVKKYITNKEIGFSIRDEKNLADLETVGRKYIKDKLDFVAPKTAQNLADPKVMAVGDVAWLKPTENPEIYYRMNSKKLPMEIWLKQRVYGGTQSELNREKNDRVKYKKLDSDKVRSVHSKTTAAGGLKGMDNCVFIGIDNIFNFENQLWCTWATAGNKNDINLPHIDLEMRYTMKSEDELKQALAAWQQMLKSLKRRN